MTTGQGGEKVWLRDDKGNLYMLTPEVLEAIKVPDDHKAEAEEVIGGKDDTAGFIDFGTLASGQTALARTSSFQFAGSSLSLVGKCMCQRTFGVQTQYMR